FFFGPGADKISFDEASLRPLRVWPSPQDNIATRPATDDWPFLYLNYAAGGIWLYLSVLVVAVLLPALVLTKNKSGPISGSAWANMFFLGQAFMLVETKSITQLSLLFGATWIVTSIVTLVVLTLAVIANWVASKRQSTIVLPLYICVLLALALDYIFSIPPDTNVHFVLLAVVASLISCLPILFGGLIFSTCFRKATSPALYLSANLLGVAVGGLSENLCLFTGIKGLVPIAMLLYVLSYLALRVPGGKSEAA
ncbi:MAG: hypothetical protein K2X81_20595, partial [Candidatus Obscuribacterales bacterium]|nr:hypothetical protein [Candidatus Obscuribacterales bacterium]